jgi:hypothetical protein
MLRHGVEYIDPAAVQFVVENLKRVPRCVEADEQPFFLVPSRPCCSATGRRRTEICPPPPGADAVQRHFPSSAGCPSIRRSPLPFPAPRSSSARPVHAVGYGAALRRGFILKTNLHPEAPRFLRPVIRRFVAGTGIGDFALSLTCKCIALRSSLVTAG